VVFGRLHVSVGWCGGLGPTGRECQVAPHWPAQASADLAGGQWEIHCWTAHGQDGEDPDPAGGVTRWHSALHYRHGVSSIDDVPINGSNGKRAWRVVALVAILAVVIGTTAGELWHRHVNCSPETCPICHLSHQVVELPVAAASTQILVPAGRQTESPRPTVTARFVVSHLPARAPPAWR